MITGREMHDGESIDTYARRCAVAWRSAGLAPAAARASDSSDAPSIPEAEKHALRTGDARLAWAISRAYGSRMLGERKLARAYAWALVATALDIGEYGARFRLAEDQQYWEHWLKREIRDKGEWLARTLLREADHQGINPGKPFDASWWGWEDDPVPDKPGSEAFSAGLRRFLSELDFADEEVERYAPQVSAGDRLVVVEYHRRPAR